jgi:hypothetical protein
LGKDDEITYIHQRYMGVSAAYSMGLRMSTARYVQFVGSHDLLIRAPYEHCLDIARYHNPDVVFYKNTDNPDNATTQSLSCRCRACPDPHRPKLLQSKASVRQTT